MGLNAIQTVIPWFVSLRASKATPELFQHRNVHEQVRGSYVFDGGADIVKFIQTAQEVGLLVLLRPGP